MSLIKSYISESTILSVCRRENIEEDAKHTDVATRDKTQHNNMHLPFLQRLLLFICLVYSIYALKEKEDLQYKVDIIDKPVKKEIRKQVTSQLLATRNIPIVLSTISLIPLYLLHTLSISHSHLSFSPHFKYIGRI